jgi:hypothetical protein
MLPTMPAESLTCAVTEGKDIPGGYNQVHGRSFSGTNVGLMKFNRRPVT